MYVFINDFLASRRMKYQENVNRKVHIPQNCTWVNVISYFQPPYITQQLHNLSIAKKNHDLTKYASVVLVNSYVIVFLNIQIKILGSLTFLMIASSLCADTWSLLATVHTVIVSELMSVPAGSRAAVILSWQWQHLDFWL